MSAHLESHALEVVWHSLFGVPSAIALYGFRRMSSPINSKICCILGLSNLAAFFFFLANAKADSPPLNSAAQDNLDRILETGECYFCIYRRP